MGVSRKIAQRRGTPAVEAHSARQTSGSGGRIHHAHRRGRPQRRRDRRRHAVPLQLVAGYSHARGRSVPLRCCCITIWISCSASCATSWLTASKPSGSTTKKHYESVLRFVERFQPALVPKVKLYTREAPIFDAFGVTAELEKALRPKVWLKSGGYIVINQTEALVAIDVNTGKYVGQVESPGRHHRQDQYRSDQRDRPADPPARPGRHHRDRFHRHGRAQESPEGDAGAGRSDARRSGAVQNSPVQRFRARRYHAQAREAIARTDSLFAVSALRRRGLREERRRRW